MEFVRHRVFSFAQESTRYCNYSKDKFGNELTFILPNWVTKLQEGNYEGFEEDVTYYKYEGEELDDRSFLENGELYHPELAYLHSITTSERDYLWMISRGWTPQQARSILPNSLKTELVMTGFVSDWKGFFKLRDANTAHPQARELAQPLHEEFKTLGLV